MQRQRQPRISRMNAEQHGEECIAGDLSINRERLSRSDQRLRSAENRFVDRAYDFACNACHWYHILVHRSETADTAKPRAILQCRRFLVCTHPGGATLVRPKTVPRDAVCNFCHSCGFFRQRCPVPTKFGNSTTLWAAFPKWREERSVFVLHTSPYVFHVLPKRAFGPEQVEELREMLKRNIPDKK
ncbi:MAG: YcxB-like protein [Candidatus Angelobacter sp.]|nr:YcxB-like protein [Candidatus Angelobacter sp.]